MMTNSIVWIIYGIGLVTVWGLIANVTTGNKRHRLIEYWAYSGSYVYAHKEYELVTYHQHFWRIFTFRSARSLYGPVIQGVWNHPGNNVITYDKLWWLCYQEIYRKLDARTQKKTRHHMSRRPYGSQLPIALEQAGINPYEWIDKDEEEQPPKFSMTAGAEEYDQIIAVQDMMEPQ